MAQLLKSPPAMWETWVSSPGWEDPWRREGQPAPLFFLESPGGQRSLAGYGPWGRRESDPTKRHTRKLK